MHSDGCISPIRVLLVEDHEPFRRFVRTTLTKQKDLYIVAETGNGLDAVSKCLELKPDLVLMDIGLPGLNGIEAARRIRALVPTCRIVFLTQESASEIAREALNLGASGYVLKAHASNDLMAAIAAAQEGRQFVSKAVALHNDDVRPAVSGDHQRETLSLQQQGSAVRHLVHFYPDEASLLAGFTEFIQGTLASGNAVIAIITESHRKEILQLLQARGLDVAKVMDAGRFVPVDVDESLASFIVDGLPDSIGFLRFADELVKKVKAMNQAARVLACGEMSPILWSQGNGGAAVQLEQLWSQLARMHDLEIYCGYMLTSSQRKGEIYNGICAAHSSNHSF